MQRIRAIAIGLVRRDARLLGIRVIDDAGRVRGVRPPGGSIEFGERAATAVAREFEEELGAPLTPIGGPIVVENLYTHEGTVGHEIVFAFLGRLPASTPVMTSPIDAPIEIVEDDGLRLVAEWTPIEALRAGATTLLPRGLVDLVDWEAPSWR